jgi:nitrite reductase (NO-forming)
LHIAIRRRSAFSTGSAALIVSILALAVASLVVVDFPSNQPTQNSTSQSITTSRTQSSTNVVSPPSPMTRHISLVAKEADVNIAPNVTYHAWTFNGTVPAPTITLNLGDTMVFTLFNNDSAMAHSIDFHAAEVDWSTFYRTVAPGQSLNFSFTAHYPGIFMYHCGTPPVLEHIGNGMYGAIIVNPITPLPAATGGEYVLIQSEFYLNSKPGTSGSFGGNFSAMLNYNPNYVVFNGKANQYQKAPLAVEPNQLVRLYVLNVGPNHWSAFHVIGALMDTVYIDGNPANAEHGMQTLNIPPSGGAIVDMYFRDPGGKNPFVTHDFADASKGAVGVFTVGTESTTITTTTASTKSTSVPTGPSVHVAIPANSGTNTSSLGYSPGTITVIIGVNNTVVWTNLDNTPHTVTALDHSFDSGAMNAGDSFTHTFTSPGTYHYGCTYHTWMKGTVIVKSP